MLRIQGSVAALMLMMVGAWSHGAEVPPVIGGLARSQLEPAVKGSVLLAELNCVACHEDAARSEARKAPRLAAVGARLHPDYLERFLQNPHEAKPGTTMPDVMTGRSPAERQQLARELTHFLRSLQDKTLEPSVPDAVAAVEGHRLFHARGCAACHAPRDAEGHEQAVTEAIPMGVMENRYSFASLTDFLERPHAVRPSGRMPDLRLPRHETEKIAHFLLQKTRLPGRLRYTLHRGRVFEGIGSEEVKPERAGQTETFAVPGMEKLPHHSAVVFSGWLRLSKGGPYRFQGKFNGGRLVIGKETVLDLAPSDRRGVQQKEGTIELPPGRHPFEFTYYHTGRDPLLEFAMEGGGQSMGPIPADWLTAWDGAVAVPLVPPVDPMLAAAGRKAFAELGCARCHDDAGLKSTAARPLPELRAGAGCLGDADGPWPRFGLSPEQRDWIRAALAVPSAQAPDERTELHRYMVTFQCIACHERRGLGGVAPDRLAHFSGSQPAMGDQGRLPPPLSDVGAKLQQPWLADVLLRGRRVRSYLDAVMPQYGEANVGKMAALFGKVDRLEDAALPAPPQIEESKQAGYQMVGTSGLGCIVCHEFHGQKSGEISALDIGTTTQRLTPNWFALYMRQPTRFHPTVIMPSYWPEGKAVRPEFLGGDSAQQIAALWNYLGDGERARKPEGLSRQSNDLRVGDVAEICRGQSRIGYRGIAVGYPERINLAFDSGEMALRQLWKGGFASADAGHFHPRGSDLVEFPPGVPFHRLGSMDENWPYKGKTNHAFPQNLGYQFRGYHLDAVRRPTFLYQYGNVRVSDRFEDVKDGEGQPFFRRTLTMEADGTVAPFHFRVAAGESARAEGERSFVVGPLRVRIAPPHTALLRTGGTDEILIPLTLAPGPNQITVEYQW
jgi:cytochrome c553